MKRKNLSISLEDYLEAIYVLSDENGETRATDISKYLGHSKPSVNAAVKTLNNLGLLKHKPYGKIKLSTSGRAAGANILSSHILLKDFFTSILNIPLKSAEEDACRAEHALSEKSLSRLRELTSFLKKKENRVLLEEIRSKFK